jgi:hypothetical protein
MAAGDHVQQNHWKATLESSAKKLSTTASKMAASLPFPRLSHAGNTLNLRANDRWHRHC